MAPIAVVSTVQPPSNLTITPDAIPYIFSFVNMEYENDENNTISESIPFKSSTNAFYFQELSYVNNPRIAISIPQLGNGAEITVISSDPDQVTVPQDMITVNGTCRLSINYTNQTDAVVIVDFSFIYGNDTIKTYTIACIRQ